jgi:hypothetical protein
MATNPPSITKGYVQDRAGPVVEKPKAKKAAAKKPSKKAAAKKTTTKKGKK